MITLVNYENKYQPDFKRLNLEWLDKYGLTESHDLEIMNDPQSTVLAPNVSRITSNSSSTLSPKTILLPTQLIKSAN